MKTVYLVRHCKASGQAPDDPLTYEGFVQAETLAAFLHDCGMDRIIASPFLRARQSVEPFAASVGLPIELDERLAERMLCSTMRPNFVEMLQASFADPLLCFEGGESGEAAAKRGMAVVENILLHSTVCRTVVVTHGNLLALMLQQLDSDFGFDRWQSLTNPDLYCVTVDETERRVERIWDQRCVRMRTKSSMKRFTGVRA